MANTKPALQVRITIDSTNKYLDVTSTTDGDKTVTLTEQDYATIHTLCSSIQTGLQALGGDWASVTCTVSDEGVVTIDSGVTGEGTELEWADGANSANTVGTILGFDTSADDSGDSFTADYQHKYGWYPHRYPARMGPWKPESVGGEMRRTLSGSNCKRLYVATHHTYEVEFALLDAKYVFTANATSSDTNKDLEHTWDELAQGAAGAWYPDASDTGTSTTCYLTSPRDWSGVVTRPHTDYAGYALSLRFREQEP